MVKQVITFLKEKGLKATALKVLLAFYAYTVSAGRILFYCTGRRCYKQRKQESSRVLSLVWWENYSGLTHKFLLAVVNSGI